GEPERGCALPLVVRFEHLPHHDREPADGLRGNPCERAVLGRARDPPARSLAEHAFLADEAARADLLGAELRILHAELALADDAELAFRRKDRVALCHLDEAQHAHEPVLVEERDALAEELRHAHEGDLLPARLPALEAPSMMEEG